MQFFPWIFSTSKSSVRGIGLEFAMPYKKVALENLTVVKEGFTLDTKQVFNLFK